MTCRTPVDAVSLGGPNLMRPNAIGASSPSFLSLSGDNCPLAQLPSNSVIGSEPSRSRGNFVRSEFKVVG